jgi:hypothetical protein
MRRLWLPHGQQYCQCALMAVLPSIQAKRLRSKQTAYTSITESFSRAVYYIQ